jgi:hypothetical protein
LKKSLLGFVGFSLMACGGEPDASEFEAGYEAFRTWALAQGELPRAVTPGVDPIENDAPSEYDMNDPLVQAYQRRAEAEARSEELQRPDVARRQEALVMLQGYGVNTSQERCVYPGDTWCAVPKSRTVRWNINRAQNVHPWWMERLNIAIWRLEDRVQWDGFEFIEDTSSSDYINILYDDLWEGALGVTQLMVKSSACTGYNWWYPSRLRGICKAHDAFITIDSVQVRDVARNDYGLTETEEGHFLEGIILHEFGHALGLGHHGDRAALMHAYDTPENLFAWDFSPEEHDMLSAYRP